MRKPLNPSWMRSLFGLLPFLFFFSHSAPAQQLRSLAERSTTRAVVIGISDYQNEEIRLNFADDDARAFAAFLHSKAGGSVPEGNIYTLYNEEATQGRIAAAFDWLLEHSQQGDKAFIYFAGHGDMETKTMMQHGFLLAWDAPINNYMGGGVFPVFFLQSIVATLSTQKDVEVYMFSDACRAGKLAGSSIGGQHATAKILSKEFANEIKVLSCQPDEFSLEGKDWGGGRGLFSYYLLQGLMGQADEDGDRSITVLEIEDYLQDKVRKEAFPYRQIPMTVGNKGKRLFRVDREALKSANDGAVREEEMTLASIESRGLEEIAFAQSDSSLLPVYLRFQKAIQDKKLLGDDEDNAYHYYEQLMAEENIEPLHGLIRRKLAAALQDEAQQAMNTYLQSPEEELKRRWNFDPSYNAYPAYLAKSAEILGSGHYMHKHLQARALYFEGLDLRLKAEKAVDKEGFDRAMALQDQVLELHPEATYALNEKGLIYLHRPEPDLKEALDHFEKASELSPTWVLPLLNKAVVLRRQGNIEEAVAVNEQLIAIDSTFAPAYNNLSIAYSNLKMRAQAEAMARQAVELQPEDPEYWFTLGQALLKGKDYKNAIHWFEKYSEAFPNDAFCSNYLGIAFMETGKFRKAEEWFLKGLDADPALSNIHNNLGWLYLVHMDKLPEAETAYRNLMTLVPDDPIPYYNLACIASRQTKYEASADWLDQSIEKGWNDFESIRTDPDLAGLRTSEHYRSLAQRHFPEKSE